MTLLMFEWQEGVRVPQIVEHALHVCANQERLNSFLEDHSVLPFKEMIVNPWTGVYKSFAPLRNVKLKTS
jgi:hypothetical protein